MVREIRKGRRFISVHGEMYQHHDVWIPSFEEWIVGKIAEASQVDENHIIGKIVEEWIGQHSLLQDRIDFYNKVTVPKLREKYANKDKEASKEDDKSKS